MTAIRSTYSAGKVRITKHHIDWDTYTTVSDERIKTLSPDAPRVYVNPEYTVEASADVPVNQFVRQARRAQTLWIMRVARWFGSGARNRLIKQADSRVRQLAYIGILFLDGQPIDPRSWPDARVAPRPKKRRGETWRPPPLGGHAGSMSEEDPPSPRPVGGDPCSEACGDE